MILKYAPSQPLTSEEKDLIWKFRFYLTRDKRGLTKFLKSVTWRDPSEVKQAVEELLPQWTEIDIDDALELLGPNTVDSRVRAYAVKQLNRADDDVSNEASNIPAIADGLAGASLVLAAACASIEIREYSQRPTVITIDDERSVIRRQWSCRLPHRTRSAQFNLREPFPLVSHGGSRDEGQSDGEDVCQGGLQLHESS